MRLTRVLCLCAAAVAAALIWRAAASGDARAGRPGRTGRAPGIEAQRAADAEGLVLDLARFRAELERLRAGETADAAELRALARALAAQGREDAGRVLEYYLA